MSPDLQERLARLQGRGRLPSVVAGVLADGSLTWVGGAGDVPGPPDDTQYRIGSITKTLVAVAVMRCRDDGLLSLDDPIGRIVPETGYAASTVRDLLAHVSGMQSEPVGSWWERSPGVPVQALLAANDGSGAVAGPGDFYHYSNLGFALLGEAVARLRAASWWDVVSRELLEPLGMTRTTYLPAAPHAQGLSVDHFAETLTQEPHQDTRGMAPAGQAWSTVADLARWGDFLATGHPDVLARTTLDEMATAQSPGYGLGLRLIDLDGRPLAGHTGSMPGFLASLFVDRETRRGSVLMTNAFAGQSMEAVPGVLLGDDEPAAVEPWRPSTDVPAMRPGPARPVVLGQHRPRAALAPRPAAHGRARRRRGRRRVRGARRSDRRRRGLPPRRDPPRPPPRRRFDQPPGLRDVRLHTHPLRPGRRRFLVVTRA